MDNDMTARRAERLSPAGAELLAEMQRAMEGNPDDHGAIPQLAGRMEALPASDQAELAEILGVILHGARAEAARLEAIAEAAQHAERAILAAQEKLRAEGKPVDAKQAMTVAEAYQVLGGNPSRPRG